MVDSTINIDSDGVALLTIDVCSRKMNILTPELMTELQESVERVANDPAVIGMVITSGKPNGFIAGADLTDLVKAYDVESMADAYRRSARLSGLYRRLETCGKPIAAALNGLALGGGLELALSCHYRIMVDHPKAVLGLPEVKVGLLPGAGGTQRLARLIGIGKALPLMLTGDSVSAQKALELGIIDRLAPVSDLVGIAKDWIKANPGTQQPWDVKGFKIPGGVGCLAPHAVESFQIGTSRQMAATQRNYPAPLAIMSAVFEGTQVPIDQGLTIESKYFARLLTHPVARNLMRTMFIRKGEADKLMRRPAAVERLSIRKLGVLGAGMMGSGIAHVAAQAGIHVILLDETAATAEKGKLSLERPLRKEQDRGRKSADDVTNILARIAPTADYNDLHDCDLVIEAVFEDRAIKHDVLMRAIAVLPPATLMATNTSTLPITGLASLLPDPTRMIGIHFFSPVERMPLVEVIRGRHSTDKALAHALDFVAALRKTPIVVQDNPGFFTSRVFGTFVDEGMAMLAEGVKPALIENAARMAGMPVGPLAITDEVSIALQMKVHEQALADGLAAKFQRLTAIGVVKKMISLGRHGRGSSAGFYTYPAEGPKYLWSELASVFPPAQSQPSVESLRERFLYIQAIESARCVEEGIISVADADLASVLGIGYPSWTGGTISFIDTVGINVFVATCRRLTKQHGARFAPSRRMLAHAKAGRPLDDLAA